MHFGKKILTLAITGVAAVIGGYGNGNGYIMMQGVIFIVVGGGAVMREKMRKITHLYHSHKDE